MTDGADTVEAFPVRVTLEDQLALQMRCLRTPAMRAGRARRYALAVLLSPLYALACGFVGVLISWFGDGARKPLGPLLWWLLRDDWPSVLALCVGVAVLTATWMAVGQRLLRPRMRRLLRRVLRAHPAVDPADPLLAYTAEVGAGPDGLWTRSASGLTVLNWAVLKRWEEAEGRLFVLGDAMVGLCLPMAGVAPARLDALRRVLASLNFI